MAVKQRDIVLIGKDISGDQNIYLPITRLGNVSDEAQVKAAPEEGDYIPVMDGADGGQMKKFPFTPSGSSESSSGGGESGHRYYRKTFDLSGGSGANTLKLSLTVTADIFNVEIDGVKKKAVQGDIFVNSLVASGTYSKSWDVLKGGSSARAVPIVWKSYATTNVNCLLIKFIKSTDSENPINFGCELFSTGSFTKSDSLGSGIVFLNTPFFLVED